MSADDGDKSYNLIRWPAFPIFIAYRLPSDYRDGDDYDVELISALKYPDCLQHVDLHITTTRVEEHMYMCPPSPVDSWADLPHVYNTST